MINSQFSKIIGIFAFLAPLACCAEAESVIINEIAWMGTIMSGYNEWIELKNTNQETVLLNGWQLRAEDGTPSIELEGKINAGGFFILERTDNDSCPDVEADIIYKGALSNSGETLVLLNDKREIIDKIEARNGWPAGDNKTKQTMEKRRYLETWQTSTETGGTPGKENSDLPLKKKKESVLVSKELYTNKADKRFLEVILSGLTSSFCLTALTLIAKKSIKGKKYETYNG